jgi:hypothetical protein
MTASRLRGQQSPAGIVEQRANHFVLRAQPQALQAVPTGRLTHLECRTGRPNGTPQAAQAFATRDPSDDLGVLASGQALAGLLSAQRRSPHALCPPPLWPSVAKRYPRPPPANDLAYCFILQHQESCTMTVSKTEAQLLSDARPPT